MSKITMLENIAMVNCIHEDNVFTSLQEMMVSLWPRCKLRRGTWAKKNSVRIDFGDLTAIQFKKGNLRKSHFQ